MLRLDSVNKLRIGWCWFWAFWWVWWCWGVWLFWVMMLNVGIFLWCRSVYRFWVWVFLLCIVVFLWCGRSCRFRMGFCIVLWWGWGVGVNSFRWVSFWAFWLINKERNYLIVIILKRAIKVLGNLLLLSLILSWYF